MLQLLLSLKFYYYNLKYKTKKIVQSYLYKNLLHINKK